MKNSHLKNSLIAAGIAVFAGVVTLGASVAIGATPAPTQDPTTANGVGPTFTALTVGGNTTIGGILDVAGAIKNTVGGILQINSPGGIDLNGQIRNDTVANAPVMFNDSNGVALKAGDLDVQAGSIKNTGDGIVKLNGNVDISGVIRNEVVGGGLPVKFNDANGVAILAGDLDIQAGGLKNTLGGIVQIINDLNVVGGVTATGMQLSNGNSNANLLVKGGALSNSGNLLVTPNSISNFSSDITLQNGKGYAVNIGNLAKSSNLNVNGDINATGEVKAATWLRTKDFQSTGTLWSDGDAYFKFLDVFNEGVGDVQMQNGNIKASGDLTIGNNVNDQKFLIYPREGSVFKGDFLQITSDKADGTWDWNNGIIMKRGTVEGSPSTVFQVNGKITSSKGFGTPSPHSTTYAVTGKSNGLTASCNAGELLLSCGITASGWGYVNTLNQGTTSCTAYFNNTDAGNANVTVQALCLDPTK